VDPERQAADDVVHELDGRPLIAGAKHFEDADAGAVVDRGELVEPRLPARNPLEELHIQLQAMAWLWLLVALPALAVGPVPLIGGEPIQPVPRQDAMHGGRRKRLAMKARQVGGDAAGAEVVGLSQVEDLPNDVSRRGSRRLVRPARSIAHARRSVRGVAPLPLVERLAGDAEMPACPGHGPRAVSCSLEELQPPADKPCLLCLRHCFSIPASCPESES
jgi:hypothetical protein